MDVPSTPQLNHHMEVIPGILGPECSAQLLDFFERRRREPRGEPNLDP